MDQKEISNQKIKGRFVNREVYLNVSIMVYELSYKIECFPDWYDKLMDAYIGPFDYEKTAREEGWIDIDQYKDASSDFVDDNMPNFVLLYNMTEVGDTSFAESWEELCEEQGLYAYEYAAEVYEHWVVSRFLAQKLESFGEKVIQDILGVGPIWCRCTTGQAILLDGVINEICSELQILEGQKHSWSERD